MSTRDCLLKKCWNFTVAVVIAGMDKQGAILCERTRVTRSPWR